MPEVAQRRAAPKRARSQPARVAELIVVGAGPAGLAVAGAARQQGLDAEIVEAADSVASSWRGHYDRLHLHTTRRLSSLPGRTIPSRFGTWVARDDFIAYLEDYAQAMDLRITFGTKVDKIEPNPEGWKLRTTKGELEATNVVVATGYNNAPHLPDWPGRESFAGELIHSSQYRNPQPYQERDVLVVGSGNSGAEIAADLSQGGARHVWISVRTPPNIVRRSVGPLANQHLGIAVHRLPVGLVDAISLVLQKAAIGDLRRYGLEPPAKGAFSRILEDEQIPLIDVGFLRELKAGRIQVVPEVERMDGDWVVCGTHRVRPHAVVAATGYKRGLDELVGHLGVLAANGRPEVHAPDTHPRAPGLYFIGYTNPIVGNLYEVARVADRLALALARAPRHEVASPTS